MSTNPGRAGMRQLTFDDIRFDDIREAEEAESVVIERIRQRENALHLAFARGEKGGIPARLSLPSHRPFWWVEYLLEQRRLYLRMVMDSEPESMPPDLYALYCRLWGIAPGETNRWSHDGGLDGQESLRQSR